MACATDAESAHGDATATTSPPSAPRAAAAPETAAASAAALPKPERLGLDAKVVWTAPPSLDPRDPSADCGPSKDRLSVTEIRTDDNRVYFDLVHEAIDRDGKHPGEPAELIEMLLNGCPAPVPRIAGTVWRDWETPTTASISLVDLPDGELDLIFMAFGTRRTLPVRKSGKQVRYLRTEDRAGYEYDPGDPAQGVEPHAMLRETRCPSSKEQR